MSKVTSFLLAASIIVLNYLDYAATKYWLMMEVATEANPLMAKAIETGNFEVKLLTVPLALLFLIAVRDRKKKLVDCGIYSLTTVFLILNMYHLHIYLTINALYHILLIMLFPIGLS